MASESDYARFCSPERARRLAACALDVSYHKAEGDRVYTRDAQGAEVAVLDLVGGFGAGVLGHNHPQLVEVLRAALADRVPFLVQGSRRDAAGALCRRLSELAGRLGGRQFVVALASTGTEAVEMALKHAMLERGGRLEHVVAHGREQHRVVLGRLRNRECSQVPRLAPDTRWLELTGEADPDLEEAFAAVARHARRLQERPPLFLALEGAFHGKTSGSLQLTAGAASHYGFRALGPDVRFVPREDLDAVRRVLREQTVVYWTLTLDDDGLVRLAARPFVDVAALFMEPIQGEGGVRPLTRSYLQALQGLLKEHEVPLVADEIQTGCGRTGTFLASEQLGVQPDYVLVSKALGGGLAKVSALLVDAPRYQRAFSSLHTSTFAEDELGCRVALSALELIAGDGSPGAGVLPHVRSRGLELLGGLRELQRRFPEQIHDVRGVGLMVGVQFGLRQPAASPTLRLLEEQGALGLVIAGYLLHRHRVRALPTLSNPHTLRLQPSAGISPEDLRRVLAALEDVARHLHDGASHELVAPLCSAAPFAVPDFQAAAGPVPLPRVAVAVPRFAGRVTFLANLVRPEHLGSWDPTLRALGPEALGRFVQRTHRELDPFVSHTAVIESQNGDAVHLTFMGLMFTADQVQAAFRAGDVRWIEGKILEGVRQARKNGSSVVGLGGFTSILTGQGTRIPEDRVGITSGNALTVAMGVDALVQSAEEQGVALERATLGVVGATGNIGSLYAQILAERVPQVVLVGRPGHRRRLKRVADEIYWEVFKSLERGGEPQGVARIVAETHAYPVIRAAQDQLERVGLALHDALVDELGDRAPVKIAAGLEELAACELVLSASSDPAPILERRYLKPGPVVVCDLALPEDSAPCVHADPEVRVIRGGVVQLPKNPDFRAPGVPLEPGLVHACLGETLLLGLTRISEHFSWGRVTKAHVERIRDLADYHGFRLSRPSLDRVL
ncbi:MAG: aminotransferase class III-fold pyridoxal phosphate-dependent enzyme [Planctomycetota bacterium]